MKQRGSALIFVLAMVFSITSMVLVTASMTRSVNDRTETVHRAAQEKLSLSGSAAFITAKSNNDSVLTAMNYTVNIADQNYTVRAIDHSASIKQTYAVSTAGSTRLKTTGMTAMTGTRRTSHPLYYALWVGASLVSTGSQVLTTTTDNGFVYASTFAATGTRTLSSDLAYKNSTTLTTVPYGEVDTTPNESFFPFSVADYTAALPIPITVNSFNGFSLGGLVGGFQSTYLRTGSLSVQGILSGTGVIVVNGNLSVTANLLYALPTDRCVFIVNGSLTFSPGVTSFAGHFYVSGSTTITTTGVAVLSRGALVVNGNCTYDRLTINPDPFFLQNQDQCAKYRIPGFWPVADPKLVRP